MMPKCLAQFTQERNQLTSTASSKSVSQARHKWLAPSIPTLMNLTSMGRSMSESGVHVLRLVRFIWRMVPTNILKCLTDFLEERCWPSLFIMEWKSKIHLCHPLIKPKVLLL